MPAGRASVLLATLLVLAGCGPGAPPEAPAPEPVHPSARGPAKPPRVRLPSAEPEAPPAPGDDDTPLDATPVEFPEKWATEWRGLYTVEGVVRDASGRPAAGAWIFPVAFSPDRFAILRLEEGPRTDSEGRFRFTWDAPAEILAVAVGDGGIASGRASPARKGGPVEILLGPVPEGDPGPVLVEVLLPGGEPARHVRLWRRESADAGGGPVFDEEESRLGGRFLVLGAPDSGAAVFLVEASGAGFREDPLRPGGMVVIVDGRRRSPLRITLPGLQRREGRVLKSDGSPAAGVKVSVEGEAAAGSAPSLREHLAPRKVTTDGEGRYAFGLLPGTGGSVRALPVDGFHGGSPAATFAAGEAVPDLRIRSLVSQWMYVVDSGGSPVPGARYAARELSEPLFWENEVGEDGGVMLMQVPEDGRLEIRVEAPGFIPRTVTDVNVGKPLAVVLEKGAAVTGTVVGPDDRPVAGIPLSLDPGGRMPAQWSRGADGEPPVFTIGGLSPGKEFVVAVHHRDFRTGSCEAKAGGAPVRLRWREDPTACTFYVEGTAGERVPVVLRKDGEMVATRYSEEGVAWFDREGLPEMVDVQVGPLRDGRLALLPGTPASGWHRVSPEAGQALRGKVVTKEGVGTAADCVATGPGGFAASFRTDARGHFSVRGIPSGMITVRAVSGDGAGEATGAVPGEPLAVEVVPE